MTIHHLQLWVPDLGRAERSWGWLLERVGYEPYRRFEHGVAWRTAGVAIVIEASPDMVPGMLHSRLRPGLNHVAFDAGSAAVVDAIVGESAAHGWSPLDVEGHPLPSGLHVAYLEDADGFEVELIAPLDAA